MLHFYIPKNRTKNIYTFNTLTVKRPENRFIYLSNKTYFVILHSGIVHYSNPIVLYLFMTIVICVQIDHITNVLFLFRKKGEIIYFLPLQQAISMLLVDMEWKRKYVTSAVLTIYWFLASTCGITIFYCKIMERVKKRCRLTFFPKIYRCVNRMRHTLGKRTW